MADGIPVATVPARVGIYGGTFDPIHIGHLVAATEVQATLALDRVVFMPAGQPPHKRHHAITPAARRLRMLELALADRPQFTLSTLDLDQATPSFTVDLLARIREDWPSSTTIFFIMGEDSLRDFPTWRAPARIAELAHLAVVRRPHVGVDLDGVVQAVPQLAGRIHCVAIPQIEISSRDLRDRAATGRPIAYQVPREVEEYIMAHQLYRAVEPGAAR